MSSRHSLHGLRATRTKSSGEPSSQYSSSMRVLQKMLAYDSGTNTSENRRQEGNHLSCKEIAIMLDYAQKSIGGFSGMKVYVTDSISYIRQVESWKIDPKLLPMDRSKLRVVALCIRGDILDDEFQRLGDVRNINRAIDYKRWAVLLTPSGDTSKPERLNSLVASYVHRFEQLGELTDIEKAITYQTQAVELTPDSHRAKPGFLNNFGNLYTYRFERLQERGDIEKAITYQTQAVGLAHKGHPGQPIYLGNLGDSYQYRFDLLGEISDLDKAIACQTQVVELIPDGGAGKSGWLRNLGRAWRARFERLGEPSDENKAIACYSHAVKLTPEDDAHKPNGLSDIGGLYLARFKRRGDPSDLDKAITYQSRAVDFTPEGHVHKPILLSNLGNSYLTRFERNGILSDVENAIACQTQSLKLTPNDHTARNILLISLGSSYMRRFEQLGELSDIDKAITYQGQVWERNPEVYANMPGLLHNLGNSYMRRFERLGRSSDITKAIAHHIQALEWTGDSDVHRPAGLNNLGMSYHAWFRAFGEFSDIDNAVACHTQAVELTPEGYPKRSGWLGNLGRSYKFRFSRLGELSDLDKAISCQIQAVELTPDGVVGKPGWLSNLGNSFLARFERLRELPDVEKAIACHTRAVELTPEGHPDKPARVNNVGNSYHRRFESCGELVDIEKSIIYHAQAMELTPDGHVNKPTWISNVGNSCQARFERLGEISDADNAIAYQSQAVKLTPDGHSDRPLWLSNIGRTYMHRFKHLGDHSDAELAMTYLQVAAQAPITQPDTQFHSARRWAACSFWLGVSPKLAYQSAMELVPRLVRLGTRIERRYELLIEIGDVAMEAASWAISIKPYDLAIEWLEEGRSIVWNQILQLRTTYENLSIVDPELAQQLEWTARELEQASSQSALLSLSGTPTSDLEQSAQQHHQLAAQWEQLLTKARSIEGFHDFMRPRKLNELRLAAKNGPIILINTHSSRCDALVLQQHNTDIAHIPLPNFSKDTAVGAYAQLTSLLGRQETRSRGFKPAPYQVELRKILAMLWSDLVKPILDFLGYTRVLSIEELPHITWCTTGPLSFLPLHAAGCYDGLQPNAPELVVSSYTPTLGALLSPTVRSIGSHSGLLAVGQQFSKAYGDLPSITEELDTINQHADGACFQKLEGSGATPEAVLNAMDEHGWVHLACHASQHPDNPAHSAFHLHEGNLTLESITKRSFKNKGLAFLSACQTATGDQKRPDESIHLAAGMMMAGYPSVIATMWSIYDIDGPEVARQVYAELLKYEEMDCTRAARALHKAVAGLRGKVGEDSFKRWVPFIHIGESV